MWTKLKRFLGIFGPGIITGAADDDPSGIATYSQAGAQFGYAALWMNIYLLPLQAAVQEACARLGAVTGKGVASIVKDHYPRWVLYTITALLVGANTINIGADLGAIAEAVNLIAPFNFNVYLLLFTGIILVFEIFTSYRVYARILKWLAVTLLTYLLTLAIVSQGKWGEILWNSFIPTFQFSFSYFFIFVGVCGTTISPYMFFWEAGEEVEEEKISHRFHHGVPVINKKIIQHIRTDNLVGMFMSGIAAWAIVAVAAIVLFPHGITDIRTAADAARALEPLVAQFPNAGFLAKLLFAGGVVSLGLLAVPVLSGSASYALAETFNFREGFNLKFKRAHGFYGAITLSTLIGLLINYIGIDPMKALVYSAVLNGIVAVPLLFIIARLASDKHIMGKYASGRLSSTLVWTTVIIMTVGAVGTLLTLF